MEEEILNSRWRAILAYSHPELDAIWVAYFKTFKKVSQNLQGNDPKPSRKCPKRTKEMTRFLYGKFS
jgi:hypothetical protein